MRSKTASCVQVQIRRRLCHGSTSYSRSENEARLNKTLVGLNIPSIEEKQSVDKQQLRIL